MKERKNIKRRDYSEFTHTLLSVISKHACNIDAREKWITETSMFLCAYEERIA